MEGSLCEQIPKRVRDDSPNNGNTKSKRHAELVSASHCEAVEGRRRPILLKTNIKVRLDYGLKFSNLASHNQTLTLWQKVPNKNAL